MSALPPKLCPTLFRADEVLTESQERKMRPYLGMSGIGRDCARAVWLEFRWTCLADFDAATLKRFADGHATEDVIVSRLSLVPEFEVHAVDSDGGQFGFKDFGNHFSGHMDGVILGVLEAPKTWHVLEVKATSDKKLTELKRIVSKVGEKLALREWNKTYYAQAVLYMHYAGLNRHFTAISTPGARDWYSIRTNADTVEAQMLVNLAERLIFNDTPPARIGERDNFTCRWCDYSAVCHGDELPLRNCRTCLHVTPKREGGWHCEHLHKPLSVDEQRKGCADHRYNPNLIYADQIDADNNSVRYRYADGSEYVDCGL